MGVQVDDGTTETIIDIEELALKQVEAEIMDDRASGGCRTMKELAVA